MKIAVLSDIHGNSVALKAVLQEINKLKIKHIYVLGDMVGYYYHPKQVFEDLANFDVTYLKGNHEILLEQAIKNDEFLIKIQKKYGDGIKIAIETLATGLLNELICLPSTRVISVAGVNIMLAHGSMYDVNQYIYPDTDFSLLNEYSRSNYDFIFLGHTHYPFVFSNNGTVIANVGSVGQARDKSGMASWCLIDLHNRSLIFKHTSYDTGSLIREVKEINPENEYLYNVLLR